MKVNREEIISFAKNEMGYVEKHSNLTKFGKWFGLDGQPWCGIFVSWCYSVAGCQLPKIGYLKGFAGVQTLFNYATKNNLFTDTPQRGDIVIFKFGKTWDHTGLFVTLDSDKITTIDGNTAKIAKNKEQDRNGGEVAWKIRNMSDNVKFINFEKLCTNTN